MAFSASKLWYKYTNADHFLIGSIAVALNAILPISAWAAPLVLLVGGAIHEWFDGDLKPSKLPNLDGLQWPWEGVKDVAWFLAPLLLRLL